MSTNRRKFLRNSLGLALGTRCAAALPGAAKAAPAKDRAGKIPFGSGHFGRWDEDEFGLPTFRYTANQAADPHAVTDLQPGILSATEHIHQVGNDLPERDGNYKSVHKRFSRWSASGGWEKVFHDLVADRENLNLMVDSTIMRAHQQATGRKKRARTRFWGVPEKVRRRRYTCLPTTWTCLWTSW